MLVVKLLGCLCLSFLETQATTYWMVTEDGLIQPQNDSPFELSRSYDLLAFLNQDTRWSKILMFYHDLKKRTLTIDKLWSKIEQLCDIDYHFYHDKNCRRVGSLHTFSWYKSYYEDGRFRMPASEFYSLGEPEAGKNVLVPDCKKISSLTFSMHTFEHLLGMKKRNDLNITSENILNSGIVSDKGRTVEEMGHWLAAVLKKNSSSWVHYNVASFYWRMYGNGPKAMECSRRAVHYAPREFKDIALFNMGMILFRDTNINDAITVLEAAYDHDPKQAANSFVLAKALALVGEFNRSINLFDKCFAIDPNYDSIENYQGATKCLWEMFKRHKKIEKHIAELLVELNEYIDIESQWFQSQVTFLRTMHRDTDYNYADFDENCEKISKMSGYNIVDMKKVGYKYKIMKYYFEGRTFNPDWFNVKGVDVFKKALEFEIFLKKVVDKMYKVYEHGIDLEFVLENVFKRDILVPDIQERPSEKRQQTQIKQKHIIPSTKTKESKKVFYDYETGAILYPNTMKVNRTKFDFDVESDWPTDEFCKTEYSKFPANLEIIYPIFLPFENKGIRLLSILSDKIGVSVEESHELPWRPPLCPNDKDSSNFSLKKILKPQKTFPVSPGKYLKDKLLEYVGDPKSEKVFNMPESEIGQRIHTAMHMKIAPKWILYTLASLYWRVRDNKVNAVQCLLYANKTVPVKHKDIVLTSMASVYLEIGHFDEAIAAAEESAELNFYEPATNMVLAQMSMVKDHPNIQIYLMKQAVRVEPHFLSGLARILLDAWACAVKIEKTDECIYEEDKSGVCSKEGVNCPPNKTKHCHKKKIKPEFKHKTNGDTKDHRVTSVDQRMVENLVENLPYGQDFLAHNSNYQQMRKNLDALLKECGPEGCLNMRPEDIAMDEDECSFQYLQLGYWMHLLSLRQLFTEADLRMPGEILELPPSKTKKVPDCKMFIDPSEDFYLQRLSKIKVGEWEPVLSLMQQVADMFDYYDYVTLGGKIAHYLEKHPSDFIAQIAAAWWCGAGGHSICSMRCVLAAYSNAPPSLTRLPFVTAVTLTHMQAQLQDAKEISYLLFYLSPKTKLGAFMVAVAHTYLREYEQAIWMYRYALYLDDKYLPASACLHAAICLMLYGDTDKANK